MDLKQRCFLICGSDTYNSYRALQAIERRFLAQDNSLNDLTRFDLEETPLDTLRQAMLTVPFLITHRLFILKNCFLAPKATQEGLVKLLGQLSPTSVVVLYQPKPCDKRLALYTWLTKHAKIQDYTIPTGAKLASFIASLAKPYNVTIDSAAQSQLGHYFPNDTWRLALEVKKLSSYALSQGRNQIMARDIQILCRQENDESLFRLADALRDHNIRQSVELYRLFIEREDPMFLAGTIASQIRALAKIILCDVQGVTRSEDIAKKSGLNPYVVKLTLPVARAISKTAIKRCYAELVRFDSRVKAGTLPSDLGILLLILRLHGTLNYRR